jgi:hypothetical protein
MGVRLRADTWLVFNTVGGNADAHAKNLSLLRSRDGRVRLAPFYDLLSTAVYPGIATKLAMTIGESADPGHIRGRDWRRLAGLVGVGSAFVLENVRGLAEAIPERARTIAAQLRTGRRDTPAAELILPVLRKRSRRLLQLLREQTTRRPLAQESNAAPTVPPACNDDPMSESLQGVCQSDGTCLCNTGFALNASTGRCGYRRWDAAASGSTTITIDNAGAITTARMDGDGIKMPAVLSPMSCP